MTELSKKLIRFAVDELRDETKGVLLVQGVIGALEDAAKDLERFVLRLPIEDHLTTLES
nr:hypothetical protein [uncultured Agathobaculum sp.]